MIIVALFLKRVSFSIGILSIHKGSAHIE